MNPELSWGHVPWGTFVPWKLLGHEGLRKRTTQVVFIIVSDRVGTVDGCRVITWCMLLYVQKYIFYFMHVGLDCFRGNSRSLAGWLGLVYFASFSSLFLRPFPCPSVMTGAGGCPNRPYISEWWSLIFLGMTEEMFLSLLLNVEPHLSGNEFWQRNLVLSPAWREVGTVPLPINFFFFVQVGHLGKHLKKVSTL